jgi:putative transposase
MGRPKRAADGGLVYHVLNRANARMTIFADDKDCAAFEQVLEEAVERTPMRLLAYCVLPNIGIW